MMIKVIPLKAENICVDLLGRCGYILCMLLSAVCLYNTCDVSNAKEN